MKQENSVHKSQMDQNIIKVDLCLYNFELQFHSSIFKVLYFLPFLYTKLRSKRISQLNIRLDDMVTVRIFRDCKIDFREDLRA